jgi:hypothetical protein
MAQLNPKTLLRYCDYLSQMANDPDVPLLRRTDAKLIRDWLLEASCQPVDVPARATAE